MSQSFSNIRVCVFDAYGTLLDVHSAAAQHSAALGDLEQPVSEMWRNKQLQYTWLRSLMGAYDDFWQVTGESLDYALASHGVVNPELRENLMNAYLTLGCFQEVPVVLKTLKENGLETAILSNGSPNMLLPVVENSGFADYLDVCLSVDEVGIFKPTAQVYQMPCDHFNVKPEEIAFLSSNCWDAIGGAHYGYQVAWCNRYNQQLDQLPAKPRAEIKDLTELLPLLGIS